MINKVILLGRVGTAPETVAEGKVCKFRMATDRNYKQHDEWVRETTWHNVVTFRPESMGNVMKGDVVYVEGRVSCRETDDGKRYYDIISDRIRIIPTGNKKRTTTTKDADDAFVIPTADLSELPETDF